MVYEREMTITHKDFLRLLPKAIGGLSTAYLIIPLFDDIKLKRLVRRFDDPMRLRCHGWLLHFVFSLPH